MTYREFSQKMNKLKSSNSVKADKLNGACKIICKFLGKAAASYFRETFCPFEHYISYRNEAYFLKYDQNKIRLSSEEAYERRLNAILLFEQQCIHHETYLEF